MKKLDHPNVVKLVEVVDDPEEVHLDADDDHWEHSFRIEKILRNILFEQLEKLIMLMIVKTVDDCYNIVVKLVEVDDDPEVHPDAEDDHWDHSLRIEKILHIILFEQLEKLMMLMIVTTMLSSLSRWTIQKRSVMAPRIWNHNCRN